MDIHLHIDRVVLEDVTLPPGGRAALGTALEAELGRLLAAGGLAEGWQAGAALPASCGRPDVAGRQPGGPRRGIARGLRRAWAGRRRAVSERSVVQAPVRRRDRAQPAVLHAAGACGQHTHGESECAECKKKGQLQRKLAVGASNDPLEQEADRIANQVLTGSLPASTRNGPLSIPAAGHPAKCTGWHRTRQRRPRPCESRQTARANASARHGAALRSRLFAGAGAFW